MAVDLTNADIYLISLCNLICTVQIFNWEDFIGLLKDWLAICQSAGDLFFVNLIINIDSWLNPTKPASLSPFQALIS